MSGDIEGRGVVKQYLLGELTDQEREGFEVLMMSDTEFFNEMLLVEEDLVEAYVNRTMSRNERQRFELLYMSTAEGREQVSFARALGKYVKSRAANTVHSAGSGKSRQPISSRASWFSQLAGSPYLRGAAAAVIVIGLGLGIWRVLFYQSDLSKGLGLLAYAYRDQRPTEARITGFNYAPAATTRGGEEKVDRATRNRAERILLDEVDNHPGAPAYHALGNLYLAESRIDDAIGWFEKAVAADPNNAQLQSDYGAALLQKGKDSQLRGESGKGFEEFAQSDEHLSRALELDGSLQEALFNRALCHESMLLYPEAEKDWQAYLQKDRASKWADEARDRLKELENQIPKTSRDGKQPLEDLLDACKTKNADETWGILIRNRELNGRFIESKIIDTYLELAAQGLVGEAKESLSTLSYIGDVIHERSGDRFMADLVRFYGRATPGQLNGVVQSHYQLKSAREAYAKPDFDAALESYSLAKTGFERVGDSCEAAYTEYMIGGCYLGQSRIDAMLALFQSLARNCEKAQYNWLLAQSLTSLSNADQYSRDFSAAINHTNRSLSVSEGMSDSIGILNSRYQLGEIYRFLNNGKQALDLYVRDLGLARTWLPKPGQMWGRYFSISRALDQLGLETAAIDFQMEALQLATEANVPQLMCRSHNFLGSMRAKRGDYPGAVNSIERAIEIANSLSGGPVRLEATAYSFLQLGSVYRKAGDFDKALQNYDRAVQSYEELGSKFFAFTARKDKLLCCIEQNECAEVKTQLEAVLNLFEDQRAKIMEDANRTTFFDGEQGVYDLAIEFEYYRDSDSKRAFDYSEKSRGRSLGGLIDTNPAPPQLDAEGIRTNMSGETQILQFSVLKNSILIWVLSKDSGLWSVSKSISADELNKKVSNLLQLLHGNSEVDIEALKSQSMDLYDLLIKPVEDKIDSRKQLCIVPDKILNYLPFGALLSNDSGKYFIEKQDIVFSPSANVFVRCSDFAREKEALKNETLTVVGNPSFDHREFPELGNLSAAAKEAEEIAGIYRSRRPLIGLSANKKQVVSEMEESTVIHLATHALTNQWDAGRSKFLLARSASDAAGNADDGVLQAREIYGLNLARARLVVLSACRTAVEKYYGGEGMIGLSRPFIAKRIPLVVASLWPVDSEATARLMTSFHRFRKVDNDPTVRALCRAQRKMIGKANSKDQLPRNWAAFVTIGGYANF